jgi:phenylalanyl-tRNA synthetase alpha subunit
MVNLCHLESTMIRHGINDIRLFYENDVRFLKPF